MVTTNVGIPEGPVSAVAERDKYIVSELKRLQVIAERQEMFIVQLVSRLSPVTQTESQSGSDPKAFPAMGVPLADDMAAVASQLETTNETLEDLLSRLEI